MTLVRPLVTDADRQWALDQCPSWAVRGPSATPDLADPDGDDEPRRRTYAEPTQFVWDRYVAAQVESFERFFNGQVKTYADWSTLWRKSWWPKAEPRKFNRKLAPKSDPKNFRTFRRGELGFEKALLFATPLQRKSWTHLGVVMFRADDPIVGKIDKALASAPPTSLTPRSLAMTGEGS